MSKYPTILIPAEDEGGGFHLAQFYEQETALRFRGSSVPLGWKFAYQYNPEKRKLTYSAKYLEKVHNDAIKVNDYDNPYGALMVRGPKDMGPFLQATTVLLRVTGPSEDEAATPPSFHGTAFYVSPSILQTARHNIQPMENVSAARLQFRTSHNTSDSNALVRGFKASPIEAADDSANLPEHLRHMLPAEGSEDEDPVDHSACKYQSDFAFLSSSRACLKVLVPGVPSSPTAFIVAAGYPGAPRAKDALAAASSKLSTLRHDVDLYANELTTMTAKLGRLFREDVLNVSPGSIVTPGQRISTHDCTTLPGYSGGPLIPIATPGVFIGHHIAGSLAVDADQNLFLAATHPAYVTHYRTHVLPSLLKALGEDPDLLTQPQKRCFLEWLEITCGVAGPDLVTAMTAACFDRS
ncbi:hypothetical protein HKX48_006262 [Thoreauomyces humboldtii]|nr:hypothetical protein HKX48_006262 [Thoreauomyces humboldtii]